MAFVKFKGALIKTDQLQFLVVSVNSKVFRRPEQAKSIINEYSRAYKGIPVILMSHDANGNAVYNSLVEHKPLCNALKEIPAHEIPLKEHTVYIE